MPFNLPISLTWLRIILIPLIIGIFYWPEAQLSLADKNLVSAVIFILAALTDWFDGFLARRLNQTSAFGAFLDPVADKLMVTAALLILVELARLNAAVALVIVGREIAISALREWMAQIGASKSIAVNSLGKIKTACQMGAIPMLLFYGPLTVGWPAKYFSVLGVQLPMGFICNTPLWGTLLLYFAAVLTIWSMFYYMRLAWPQIRQRVALS